MNFRLKYCLWLYRCIIKKEGYISKVKDMITRDKKLLRIKVKQLPEEDKVIYEVMTNE